MEYSVEEIIFNIILTLISYMIIPFVLKIKNGPYEEKLAKKIALWNSIILCLIFMILSVETTGSAGTGGAAILYYYINKAYLSSNKKSHKRQEQNKIKKSNNETEENFAAGFSKEDFEVVEENSYSAKKCFVGFLLITIQSCLSFCAVMTNNIIFRIDSMDHMFEMLGANLLLIIGVIYIIKNKEQFNSTIKKTSTIICIVITIVLTVGTFLQNIDNLNEIENQYYQNNDGIEDVTDYLYELKYKERYPYLYLIITYITDFDTYQIYYDEIDTIQNKYSNPNIAENEVEDYIQSLPLSRCQKLMLHRIAGGYSIVGSKREVQACINDINISKTEKEGMDAELFN